MPRKKLTPEVVSEPPPKPARTRRKAAPVEEIPTVTVEKASVEEPMVEATAKPRRRATKHAAVPVEKKAVPSRKAVVTSAPEAIVEPVIEEAADDEAFLGLSWRSLGETAAQVVIEGKPVLEAPVEKRGRRRRGAETPISEDLEEIVEPVAVETASPVEESDPEDAEEVFSFTFRSRDGVAKTAPPSVVVSDAVNNGVEELPAVATFRRPQAERETEDRKRGRRRGRRDEIEEGEDAVEVMTAEAEVEETVVQVKTEPRPTAITPRVRKTIVVPADAPQVIVREGVPTLVRDGRAYPPLFFSGFADVERKVPQVMEEVRLAAESGVHIHNLVVVMAVAKDGAEETAGLAAYLLQQAIAADPEAQVLFRVVFNTPPFWGERYPDARYRTLEGKLAEPSVCDDAYWGDAKANLERFVKMMQLAEGAEHIMGLHLERGEWFLPQSDGYDDSRAAERAFRDWTRTRYNGDIVSLRASWFDGEADFATLKVPEFKPEGAEGERFVRSSRKQRKYVDYHLFLSDATVGRLGDLAYAVKAASEGRYLVGVSYGYTFEWSYPASGHLALGKLLRTEEVDFVAGPPSYRSREPGGTAPFPGPIDSFAINGKLYISEEDFKTSLGVAGAEPDDDFNPSLKTPQALESVHMRGAGAALAHGSGVSWMDSWGNGWLRTASVWQRAEMLVKALTMRFGVPLGNPEVAVFIDERSLAYLVDENAFHLLVQNVREAVLRAGVSAAFYLLSDLAHRERFPESKLYLFVNAWDLRPELRAAIKSRLQRDDKVLFWLYSAGLFDSGRDSLDRVREVTGIALKPQPFHSQSGTRLLSRRHPLSEAFSDKMLAANDQLEPSYFAVPEDSIVLGEYAQTGLPSFVVKTFRDDPKARWTSVFLGEPVVNPNLIRALAQMAGAHVYDFTDDVVHVREPFLTVHCTGTGHRTVALPDKASLYDLSTGEFLNTDQPHVRFHALDGSTHNFLFGARDEIEELLKRDPADLLRVEALPPRESNVRHDTSAFDVPIMKLGEFMSGAQTDEAAEEWFLRPLAEESDEEETPAQATESSGEVGKRRRRRGGRGREGERPQRSNASAPSASDDDLGMAIVFRKKS
ncbi:hypothetical protein BH11ARM2_BH11ARM2_05630 [soil metagenome]